MVPLRTRVSNCDPRNMLNFHLSHFYMFLEWIPISFLGFSGKLISCLIASNTTLNWESYFFSNSASLWASPWFDKSIARIFTNVLMISIFTKAALSLFYTLDSIATPCSVKTRGKCLVPPCFSPLLLDIPIWNIKFSSSISVSWNIKSSGNRFRLRRTCSFNRFVGTS